MGGIIKFVLFMFSAMAFLTPPEGVEGALTCIDCETKEENSDCYGGKGKHALCYAPNDICFSRNLTDIYTNGSQQFWLERACEQHKTFKETINECVKRSMQPPDGGTKVVENLCICNTTVCNSASGSTIIGPSTAAPSSTNSAHLIGYTIFQLLIMSLGVIIHYCFTQ